MKILNDKTRLLLGAILVGLIFCSWIFLKPAVAGDSVSYVQSMHFLLTGEKPVQFSPNRLMTTIGGLEMILFFSGIFGSMERVWLLMNAIFYLVASFGFYALILHMFESRKTAFLATLFLAGNYSFVWFGLDYLMDMGGWMFYILSLLYMYRYSASKERKYLYIASACVGVGGLFKEYALLGVLPIALFLLYENRKSFVGLIRNSIVPALISIAPITAVYIGVFIHFRYTYGDWVADSYKYKYSASFFLRIIEYVKSFGSLFNLLGIFVLAGVWIFWKRRNEVPERTKLFVLAAVMSSLPVFAWGGITQRILFITVPASIILSCFFFKEYEKYFYWFMPALCLYVLASFLMDSFLLNFVNLPL